MSDKPISAYSFPADKFPIIVRAYREDNNKLVWTGVMAEPPGILEVPALKEQYGVPVWVEVEYATGEKVSAHDRA